MFLTFEHTHIAVSTVILINSFTHVEIPHESLDEAFRDSENKSLCQVHIENDYTLSFFLVIILSLKILCNFIMTT
jgi:hypothetical protein